MSKRYQLSKWFGGGAHYVCRFHNSDILLFQRHGRRNGSARVVPGGYERAGTHYPSLAALLRAVAAEPEEN